MLSGCVCAQQAVKFDTPPVIDGVVDTEHEWTAIPSASALFDSNSGQAVPEGAQFWLGQRRFFGPLDPRSSFLTPSVSIEGSVATAPYAAARLKKQQNCLADSKPNTSE